MAIRFTPAYNAEIRRVVRNFNTKRNRAIKRGFKNVPPPIKVSDLKARYTSRRALNRQLKIISKFGRRDALKEIETTGGATAIQWELNYLKSNAEYAKEFFQREYQLISRTNQGRAGARLRLDNLAAKIAILDLDIANLSRDKLKSYRATINEFINKPKRYDAAYRGFLSEVEMVMRRLGYPEGTIDKFFNKINTLTPEQFHNLYEDFPIIERIFDLGGSPANANELKLNAPDEDAKELVDTMMGELDFMVDEAKEPKDEEIDPVIQFSRGPGKVVKPTSVNKKKIPRSTLTDEQYKGLKTLGWEDLVDENK